MPPRSGNPRNNTSKLLAGVAPNKGSGRWKVVASQESDGGQGACGPIGTGGMWYSELSTTPMGASSDFHGLGGIQCGTVLNITNPANGKTVQARKRDVGAGSSFLPVMGLYPATTAALGLSGGRYDVIIERPDGGHLAPVRGTPAGGNTTASAASPATGAAGGSGGPSVFGVTGDLFALFALVIVKDMAVGLADYVVIPFWHWNQRAMTRYREDILFDPKGHPLAMPATAAFWGLGYILLFTDPGSGNLKPAPVRNTRLAHHVRRLQALPARRSLIKPKNVQGKTPKKPPPVTSRARVTQTGTLQATRSTPVRVSGNLRNRQNGSGTESDTRVQRAGTIPATQGNETLVRKETPREQSNAEHRARDGSLPTRGRTSQNRSRARR